MDPLLSIQYAQTRIGNNMSISIDISQNDLTVDLLDEYGNTIETRKPTLDQLHDTILYYTKLANSTI